MIAWGRDGDEGWSPQSTYGDAMTPEERIERVVRRHNSGFVCFIAAGPFVKVGYSENPNARIKSIQTSNPYDVELIGVIRGGLSREAEVLRQLSHAHHRREWFHLTNDVRDQINDLCRNVSRTN